MSSIGIVWSEAAMPADGIAAGVQRVHAGIFRDISLDASMRMISEYAYAILDLREPHFRRHRPGHAVSRAAKRRYARRRARALAHASAAAAWAGVAEASAALFESTSRETA